MNLPLVEFLQTGAILSSGLSSGGDEIWVGWGTPFRSEQASADHFSIYAPDFFLKDPKPWWNFPKCQVMKRSELLSCLRSASAVSGKLKWSEPPDFVLFQAAFADLKEQFRKGTLRKAVPVLFERAQLKIAQAEKAELFEQLLENSQNFPLHVYGVWNESEGQDQDQGQCEGQDQGQCEGIMGATPEIFLNQSPDGVIHSAAVAGTRLKESSVHSLLPLLSLLQDPKELEEHQIVIEGICDSFRKFENEGLGKVVVGKTQEIEFPTLFHLVTPISFHLSTRLSSELTSGLLSGLSSQVFEKMARELHPTPALGAFPKKEGMQWLQAWQQAGGRMRFGAPFGARWKSGEFRSVVSIRNLQWQGECVSLGAGCGIIPASQLDREMKEIQGKMRGVKKLFGIEVREVRGVRNGE